MQIEHVRSSVATSPDRLRVLEKSGRVVGSQDAELAQRCPTYATDPGDEKSITYLKTQNSCISVGGAPSPAKGAFQRLQKFVLTSI